MFMQMVFSKVHPACHNIANGIKPGSNSKKTDKHAFSFILTVYPAVDRGKVNRGYTSSGACFSLFLHLARLF